MKRVTEKQISAKPKRHFCNKDVKDYAKFLKGIGEEPTRLNQETKEMAKLYNEAVDFMNSHKEHLLCERIREGFIGKEIYTVNGTKFLQTERDKPKGTFIAIPVDDNSVVIGISYMDKHEDFSLPIIGQYLAYKDALSKKDGKLGNLVKSSDSAQYEHLRLRALAYFYPDEFSFSRGKNPIEYKDYNKIHLNRKKLGF